MVVLATTGATLLQCSSPSPPAAGAGIVDVCNHDSVDARAVSANDEPVAGTRARIRPSGHRRRARRDVAARLPCRPGIAATSRGRLHRIRRADAPRRAGRAPRRGRRRDRDLRAAAPAGAIRSRRCARSTTIRAPRMSCRWRTTTPRRSTAARCPVEQTLSLHAYGRAIDVNPLLNPYIDSRGDHRADDRRAVPRPQPHRPGYAARRRSRRPRLHRSRVALGRRLANTEGLSAFRAPLGLTSNAARALRRARRMTPRCGPGRRGGRRYGTTLKSARNSSGVMRVADVTAAVAEVPDVRVLGEHRGGLVASRRTRRRPS